MSTPTEVLHVLNALETTRNIRAERDVEDAAALANKLVDIAAFLRDAGRYEMATLAMDSANALEVALAEIDELSGSIMTLREERADLIDRLAQYRVTSVTYSPSREQPDETEVRRVTSDEE